MFVEIDQAPIYLKVDGEGEPALFLHGVPDSADMWNPLVQKVKDSFTCYTTDLPGIHRSGVPESFEFELKHYGQYINDLVEAAGIQTPFTLVAHDLGGIYAMSFACQFPEKVKRFVGGSFPFSHLYRWHPWAAVWRTPLLGELSMLLMNKAVFHWELGRGGPLLSREQIDESYEGKVDRWAPRKTILKMYRSATPRLFLPFQCMLERFAQQVDVDLVWGRRDKYVPTHMAAMMHPKSTRVIPECGHWVPLEAPDILAEVLLGGVEKRASGSASKGGGLDETGQAAPKGGKKARKEKPAAKGERKVGAKHTA
ncbi:hypothetical protein A3767_01765 [Oleiphilus sp. HI0133]|nr:hypothetical protein A3767_01765 [Oleiphilus sp. HI0133]